MAFPKVKISDDSGNTVAVDTSGASNALKVSLLATPTIDIGDVSLLLGGTAASTNAGTMDAQTLRVTLATDDTHWGTVGVAADSDGVAHGQLRYIATQTNSSVVHLATIVNNTEYTYTYLSTIDADTSNMATSLAIIDDWDATQNSAVPTDGVAILGEAKIIDGSALPNIVGEGSAARLAVSRAGIQYTHLTNDTGTHSAILEEDAQHATGDYGIMPLAVRNDTLAALAGTDGDYAPLQVDADGALYIAGTVDLGSTDNAVLDNILSKNTEIETTVNAIQTAVEILDDWDDSNYANVNINLAGSDAPTGGGAESGALRVTLANDSTGVISIDDGGNTITVDGTVTANLGTTDNAVLDAIAASLALLDNSIASGNELQVDVVAALPAGDNNIGNVDIASSVALTVDCNSSDVTVDNLPNWFATALGGTGSPAHQAAESYSILDAGLVAAVVCSDELAALSGVGDGEYSYLQVDTQGALYTTHGMTGMVHGANTDVDASAEQLDGSTSGLDTACKRVDLQANRTNSGIIYVGGADTVGPLTGGIALQAGDFYSIDVNNLNDIWVEASVANQRIDYIYYT